MRCRLLSVYLRNSNRYRKLVRQDEEIFLLKDKEQPSRIISALFDHTLKAENKDFAKKIFNWFKQITSKNHIGIKN